MRAADTNMDNVGNCRTLPAAPLTVAHFIRQICHADADRFDRRHDVNAIEQQRLIGQATQRRVQHCPTFGDIDTIAAKHCFDVLAECPCARQLHQERNGFASDALL